MDSERRRPRAAGSSRRRGSRPLLQQRRSGSGLAPVDDRRGFLGLSFYQAAGLLFAIVLLLVAQGEDGRFANGPVAPMSGAVVFAWCIVQLSATVFAIWSGRREAYRGLRLSIDLAFCLGLVWLTGGVLSIFSPLLVAIVLGTSTVLGRQRGLAVASSTTVVLVAITASQVLGWSPTAGGGFGGAPGSGPKTQFLFAALFGQGTALHAVAFLGARLMGGIRRIERLNDQIVAAIGDGIVALDEKGQTLLINDKAKELLGYPSSLSEEGHEPSELLRREGDARLLELLEKPEVGSCRVELEERGGRMRPLSVQVSRLPSQLGRGHLWVFLFHDLTLEEEAARASERIQHLEAIEDMALGLVHEIRNPLASIRGCAQEIGSGKVRADQVERLTRIVCRESDRLDRIVDEFFESSSASPTHWEELDLVGLFEEVCEGLRQRPDARGVAIRVEGDASAEMSGQRELLYRAFLNLGVNALEACHGRGEVIFRVRSADSNRWMIEVVDDGCGMDAATRKRIFNPFFTSKAREGGLGLSLVERILRGHGGTLSVESEPGRGTRFLLTLPQKTSPDRPGMRDEAILRSTREGKPLLLSGVSP